MNMQELERKQRLIGRICELPYPRTNLYVRLKIQNVKFVYGEWRFDLGPISPEHGRRSGTNDQGREEAWFSEERCTLVEEECHASSK